MPALVEHLLSIFSEPEWQTVLREIAQRLNNAGVSYRVVGGTSLALRGVDVSVEDIDIETDTAGAYHFQELFTEHIIKPIALRASDTYRSHFGRFDFDGVIVEVMGDLCRREDDDWIPTAAMTETTVELDGVAVRVTWLEEEMLAYVRRGRLERAAKCLPYCDQGRLLALLRGEEATNTY